MVLFGSCVARDNAAFEVSILFYVDVKAAASREESCLLACTAVVGVDVSFVPRCAECGLEEGTKRFCLCPFAGDRDVSFRPVRRTLPLAVRDTSLPVTTEPLTGRLVLLFCSCGRAIPAVKNG